MVRVYDKTVKKHKGYKITTLWPRFCYILPPLIKEETRSK